MLLFNYSRDDIIWFSILAKVQGRLRARSTTAAPSISSTSTVNIPTTTVESIPDSIISTIKPAEDEDDIPETTFKLPDTATEGVTDPPTTIEEEVITETSVSMSIGQSEVKYSLFLKDY